MQPRARVAGRGATAAASTCGHGAVPAGRRSGGERRAGGRLGAAPKGVLRAAVPFGALRRGLPGIAGKNPRLDLNLNRRRKVNKFQ
jgi:hypothetical protein